MIHLAVRGEPTAIDARPSDAIALALRTKAPIYVEESVIDNAKALDGSPSRPTPSACRNGSRASISDDLGKYKM